MPKAMWKGAVLAEADASQCHIVDGNTYFPPDAVRCENLRDSATHTVCPWKGEASYYDVVLHGEVNADAAWYYPSTKAAASHFEGYVAFWKGVTVED